MIIQELLERMHASMGVNMTCKHFITIEDYNNYPIIQAWYADNESLIQDTYDRENWDRIATVKVWDIFKKAFPDTASGTKKKKLTSEERFRERPSAKNIDLTPIRPKKRDGDER